MRILKIRRKLVWQYTVIIALMLCTVFGSTLLLNRRIVYASLDATLENYLTEEVHEARSFLASTSAETELPDLHASANVLLSLWYFGDTPVHGTVPMKPEIRDALLTKISQMNMKDGELYRIALDHRRFYRLMKQDLYQNGQIVGKVVVLNDTGNLHRNFRHFVHVFIGFICFLVLLSCWIGSFLARRAMDQIDLIFERQKRFVSDASHELRTPLSIMMAYTELLEHKPNNPTLFRQMKDEIESMTALIERLLQIARLDNEGTVLSCRTFDLSELLKQIVTDYRLLASPKNIRLRTRLKPSVLLNADQVLIRQVVYILLDNALKYSLENSEVVIKLTTTDHFAEIMVQDQGIGMAQADLEHIFERFFRADSARRRSDGSLGLGLALADMIVHRHHGRIGVQSIPDHGSTFTVYLPLE